MLTVKSRPERYVARHQFLTNIAALHYLKAAYIVHALPRAI